MQPIAFFCFVVATLAALTGMSMGIGMGMSQDFTLAPAHAHLNLLGWVTMMLYGLYYRGASRVGRLAWVQVGCATLGFPLMAGGLALLLGGDASISGHAETSIIAGSLLTIGAMALFLVTLIRTRRA